MNPLIVIPARLAATRLPNKPLADIQGEPMIIHVWRRAMAAGVGPVLVACGDVAIMEVIRNAGGNAVLTDPNLPSGSDRVHAAASAIDPDGDFDVVINLQGDMPTLDPALLRAVLPVLDRPEIDIATAAAEIHDEEELADPNVVKIALERRRRDRVGDALYFSRAPIPSGQGPHFHHVGVYAFRRAALDRFVTLPPSVLEQRERLEQLRAMVAGMKIAVALVHAVPFGVDTPADLERARALIGRQN